LPIGRCRPEPLPGDDPPASPVIRRVPLDSTDEGPDVVNLDISVAPEIAQLMSAGSPRPGRPAPDGLSGPGRRGAAGSPATLGDLARRLRLITAAPERWRSLVRFDPDRAVRVAIPADGPGEAWLLIVPPHSGWTDGDGECGCEVVTVVAGEVTEQAIDDCGVATRPLLPGTTRVHGRGQLHQVINRSDGYAVSVHARAVARAD
jgi:Cysteine dioxygenase type I